MAVPVNINGHVMAVSNLSTLVIVPDVELMVEEVEEFAGYFKEQLPGVKIVIMPAGWSVLGAGNSGYVAPTPCPYCAERARLTIEYDVVPPLGPCPLHESL